MRRALLPLLCLLALPLAGCGNDAKAKNAYVDQVNQAQQTFVARFDQIQSQLTTTSTLSQDRRSLADFQAATTTIVADLRRIKPPSGLQDAHRQLITAIAGYGTQIDRARRRITQNDPAQLRKAQADLSTAVDGVGRRIQAAIVAINQKLRS